MNAVAPILASERTAAKLLDMKPAEFRALVDEGVLPGPKRVGEFDRWEVEHLKLVACGNAIEGMGGVSW